MPEEILEALEGGIATLETAISFYEEGAKLAALCKAELEAARDVLSNQ